MTAPKQVVGLGQAAVMRRDGTLTALGLGSCVAVILHDPVAAVGGLVHVVLPSASLARDRSNPARFAESAALFLVNRMEGAGADRLRVTARLVGGASMFALLTPQGATHIGQRNVIACRLALRTAGIALTTEVVGGEVGRSVWFDVATGEVVVRSVGREPEIV
ncbi:MAG TPA: chemotaxis protein CheD [Gemmatimonadales bacterium]